MFEFPIFSALYYIMVPILVVSVIFFIARMLYFRIRDRKKVTSYILPVFLIFIVVVSFYLAFLGGTKKPATFRGDDIQTSQPIQQFVDRSKKEREFLRPQTKEELEVERKTKEIEDKFKVEQERLETVQKEIDNLNGFRKQFDALR